MLQRLLCVDSTIRVYSQQTLYQINGQRVGSLEEFGEVFWRILREGGNVCLGLKQQV